MSGERHVRITADSVTAPVVLCCAFSISPGTRGSFVSAAALIATDSRALERAQPAEVDAYHLAHLDEYHHDVVADAAPDDDARAAQIDFALGQRASRPAVTALRLRQRHLAAEDVREHSADCVAVERLHQRPPVAPNRSVLTRPGA